MEILYIWIKKYGNIEKQGFNFSGKHIFDYSEEKNEINYEENIEFIVDFFNNDKNNKNFNLVSLSAIIGENGSGKTTIMNFIKENLPHGESGIKHECIIIFEKQGIVYIYVHEKMGKTVILPKSNNFIFRTIKQTQIRPFDHYEDIPELADTSFVFLSNVYDNQNEYYGEELMHSNLLNISTNYLLHKDYVDFYNKNNIDLGSSNTFSVVYDSNSVVVHKNYDIKRQLYFYKDYIEKIELHFKLPSSMSIEIVNLKSKKIHSYPNLLTGEFYEKLLNLLSDFDEVINSNIKQKGDKDYHDYIKNDPQAKIKALLGKGIFLNFIYKNPSEYDYLFNMSFYDIKFDFKNKDGVLKNLLKLFEVTLSKIAYQDIPLNKHEISLKDLLSSNIEFLKFLILFLDEHNTYENVIKYSISSSENQHDSIFKFIDLYLSTKPNLDYINYQYLYALSSGQNAFLNIFSRIYELLTANNNIYTKLKSNIVLMIDECDVYFHPQWQKEYIENLLKDLPLIFQNQYSNDIVTLQLILTSNSPIVISDIPRNYILFLSRSENGKCKIIKHLEDKKQTFSSNIHTLFSDSFFMKEGLIGEFAKRKINKAIEDLEKSQDLSFERLEEIKKIISIIGEPLIKRKLLQMFDDKNNLNLTIYDRLLQIEKELENLKNK